MSGRSLVSHPISWLSLATLIFALWTTPAWGRIKLPTGPGGGGVIVIDTGDTGGGGGGGISFTPSDLEERGYVCRPYFDGLFNRTRCDANFLEPTAFIATLETYLCDPNNRCSRRASKTARGQVGDGLSLWSFKFPAAAKFAGFGDVDGDGDDDVVAFTDLTAQLGLVRVGLSNRTNEFSTPQIWATSFCGGFTQVCDIGDFTGDRKTDIASFDRTTGQVSVATSNGTAFVGARIWNSTFAGLGGPILVGDFNGDGVDDIATILPSGSTAGARGTVLVSLSKPGPPVLEQSNISASNTAPVATTQFTTTQLVTTQLATAPLVVTAPLATAPLVFPGGPIGGLPGGPRIFIAPVAWIGPLCPDPTECVVGDYNGDGKDDIARVRSTGESYVALSTGTSFLGEVEWSFRLGRIPRTFRSADVNNDGKDDLVAIRTDGGLTVGISSGTFFVANVDVDDMHCGDPLFLCKFANLDGDDYPELVEISSFGDSTLQTGDTFVSKGAEPRGFPAEPARPTPVDTDGDGVRDAADNCIQQANPNQADTDADGIGDSCELVADLNGDGVVNAADLAILKQNFFTNFAPADLNGDGVVNSSDLAILKRELLKRPASSATSAPRIDLVAPIHGTFYDEGTQKVWVGGFVRNVASTDGSVVVHSQTFQSLQNPVSKGFSSQFASQSVETNLAIAPDGWFEGFVPIDPQAVLNPILVEATRMSTHTTGLKRVVTLYGPSVAPGDYSASSLGARVSAWQLDEFAAKVRQGVDLVAIAAGAKGGDVKNVSITGPMSLTVRPFSDLLTIDIGFPRMHVDYEDFQTGCNFPLTMTNLTAHIEYDLEPKRLQPSRVEVKENPGSPNVEFGSFSHGEHFGCSIITAVSFTDVREKAEQGVESALRSRSFGAGPIDGKIEDTVNAIDLSQVLSSLNVVLGTRFRAIPEDVIGISFDLDSGFAATSMCGTEFCHPPLTNATARIFQTRAAHPPFPLLVPGGGLYDVALALSADTFNQLFAGMMTGGKLTSLLAAKPKDLTPFVGILGAVNLQPKLNFVPTLAPVLTGRAGKGGGTEVQLGQLLLEIPTIDGTDAFRVAVDLKGSVSLAIVPRLDVLPLPPTILKISVHDLEVLSSKVTHIPAQTAPEFATLFNAFFLPEVEVATLSVEYPLPNFAGFGLTLLGLSQDPTGGAIVFGNLDLSGSGGGVRDPINGGVLAR